MPPKTRVKQPKVKRVLKENTIKPTAKTKTPVYTGQEARNMRKRFMFTNSKGKTTRYEDT